MRLSGYDFPVDSGRCARVNGLMLRWMYIIPSCKKLVLDLWTTCKHLRHTGGVGLNMSIEFGVEFFQLVHYFNHTSLYRLTEGADSLWWNQNGKRKDREDIPATLDKAGGGGNCPGQKDCACELCYPSMVVDPRWKVRCVFDARSWMWTVDVADHWWKCGELDGEADLGAGWCRKPDARVTKVGEDLGTRPRGFLTWEQAQYPSRYFRWAN